jgi:predicted nucleic acid-binding protein
MDSRRPQVNFVLDASVALAWFLTRNDPNEAGLAQHALQVTMTQGALVPHLWYPEVANALVLAERHRASTSQASSGFLADLDSLPITLDLNLPHLTQNKVVALARNHQLTAYDAIYLELALRKGAPLATFNRKLAEACRKAGGQVFGDQS